MSCNPPILYATPKHLAEACALFMQRSGRQGALRHLARTAIGGSPLTRALRIIATAFLCLWGVQAMAADGLTTLRSNHDPKDTINRLEAAVKARDLTVFARIDHAAGAAAVGMPLRPTELLIFGNAKGGTPLMQSVQTIGIDLPLRALVWQDASGTTWLSYNDPSWLAKRHALNDATEAAVRAMAGVLDAVAKAATTSP
jgi:uncharacterized protein (DUF302 family)